MPIESWGIFGYFGHIFWDMDFEFVLPTIHINIKRETQVDHFIL